MRVTIRDVKVICCAPQKINLVTVKVETSEPGLYGVGCATFAHRHLAVVAAVEKYLKPLTDNLIMGVINEQSAGITVREEDKEFIARVYSYVFIGIMLDWIKDDMKADPKLIVDKLAILIKDSLSDALLRFKI